jgi:hypothetical protein
MVKRLFVLALVFALGLAVGAGTVAWAQSERPTYTITTDTAGKILSSTERKAVTLSSDALALRVQGRRHGRVVGTLVANVDGQWVEVQFAPQDSLAGR